MDRSKFSKRQFAAPPWFWLGLIALWGIALGLRFWGLERFDTLVFDEVYFAKFARNYLTQTPFFDAHPPLGKYLIAVGIWLKGFNPWGYRWMNALTGSCIPLLVVGLGVQIARRYSFALLAGALATLDGLLLVESRYGLINVYVLAFGLLGHWLALLSGQQRGWKHWTALTLAGLSFGAAAAVKWTGLGFLLGLYLFWAIGRLGRLGRPGLRLAQELPLEQFLRLSFTKLFIFIPVTGAVLYSLLWIPHLLQNPEFGFIEVHRQMFGYHQRVGNGPSIHPYCSSLPEWPLMKRPVSYFYQLASSLQDSLPATGPPLPFNKAKYVYSVYAMGNPPLWWSATVAIAIVLGMMVWHVVLQMRQLIRPSRNILRFNSEKHYVPLYLITGYAANILPWLSISRCAFLYHYMPAYLFSSLALAWLLETGLPHSLKPLRILSLVAIALSIFGFLFWLPVYLGLPIRPLEWQWRIWFRSWI
ncbi:phospholipid carrier-dependent glycosyltransferase [Altericista sp. CCNU0014]|uniref:phospholipid carrier-dependent glycosyltransferase n=1 Tax=Altericista sp. CCNU0014 TaxID=3082949 RepID=UPI00384D800E